MKNTACILSSAILLIFFLSACRSNTNIDKETEAIKAVINAETQAWIDKDASKIKEFYIKDEYQTRVNIQDSIFSISTGWDNRSPALDSLTTYYDWSGVDQFKVEKDFLVIKVKNRTAWAILHETQNMIYHGSPATAESIINIMLEKENKDWKISCFVKSNI
jgi:hypothetical protein